MVIAVFGLTLGVVGCRKQPHMQLIQPDRTDGEFALNIIGSPEHLLEHDKIDLHKRIEMPDGAEMDVWAIEAETSDDTPNSKGAVVLIHDFARSKADMFDLGRTLSAHGYDAVLPDLRAHGRSEGKYFTYGVCEAKDLKIIVDTLVGQGAIHTPVYAYGDVRGGTVAIQYAAADDKCAGVIATRPVRDFKTSAKLPLRLMSKEEFNETVDKAGKVGGFVPEEASALKAAEKLGCPVLLIDRRLKIGEALVNLDLDPLLLPEANSKAIYEAASEPKKLVMINPGLQEIIVAIGWNDWLAQKMDELASGKLEDSEQTKN